MNRGVLQNSPVQQMMAGNPNLWSINNMRPPTPPPPPPPPPPHHHHHHHQQPSSLFLSPPIFFPQFITPPLSSSPSSSTLSSSSSLNPSSWNDGQDQLPESWSQLLMGGMVGDEDKAAGSMNHFQAKKMQNWEEQILHHQQVQAAVNSSAPPPPVVLDVKQENSPAASSYMYGHANEDFQQATKPSTWSPIPMVPASSPKSCVTSFGSDMLDFSSTKGDGRHPPPDRSSECNSTATGGAVKKARVQPSSTQSPMKVRKEKLGDRITALHQLVSPFGKTDTASVLLEAIGYIRFLQNQIEALSLPYLGSSGPSGSANMRQQQQQHSHVQGERNCVFPEDPGQDSHEEPKKDLRSRGLCLVPVSCTLQVGSDNGADYWAPALGGGFR